MMTRSTRRVPSRRRLRSIAMILPVLLIAASAAPGVAAPGLSDAADTAQPTDYRLGPGDKIHIIVYDEASMTGDYTVSARGTVSFPLIGDVPAGGETIAGFRAALENRLSKGILNDPKVAAEIVEYRPFYILGEVNKPGQYPYSIGLTVYSAVATAQGFTYRANTHKVLITHAGENVERRVRINAATRIMPGDTVRVLERFF